jgi:hypothetical protein
LIDSFLNVRATHRTMYDGRDLAAPISTLNELTSNLCKIDLISRLGQKEDEAFQSMDQIVSTKIRIY